MNSSTEGRYSTVRITLRPLACPDDRHGWSGYRRLRAALKWLLRTLSMRCTSIAYDVPEHDPAANGDQGGPEQ